MGKYYKEQSKHLRENFPAKWNNKPAAEKGWQIVWQDSAQFELAWWLFPKLRSLFSVVIIHKCLT